MASYVPTDPNVPVHVNASVSEPKRVSAVNVDGADVIVYVGGDNTVSGANHTDKLNEKQTFIETEEPVWVVGGRGVLVEYLTPRDPVPGLLHDNKTPRTKLGGKSKAEPRKRASRKSSSKRSSKAKSSAKK